MISNGYGEDSIAAEVVRRLPPDFVAAAYPTLGAGLAYRNICPLVGPRRFLPSEGVRRRGSLRRDARAGFGISAALGFMRREARGYDAIVVVGDLLGVIMSWLSGNRVRIFVDVYRSGYANRYAALETFIIRQSCDLVLSRDELLAASLRRSGVNAVFAGNALMDTLVRGTYDVQSRRRHDRAIAILPGSRSSAAANFALQIAALRQLPKELDGVDLFAVLAPDCSPADLKSSSGLELVPGSGADGDLGALVGAGLHIHLSTGALGSVLEASDLVLGQGGTANLQALGLGKPVVSFLPRQARDTRARRIAALVGDGRIVVDGTPEAIAAAIAQLLHDDADRLRRGAIGRERIGPGGAIDAIIAALRNGRGASAQ